MVLRPGSGSDEVLVCDVTHALEFQDAECTCFCFGGSWNARSSGLSLQNLVCVTDSLVWSADISFSSDSNSSVRSFQIVSKFFSPEMHMSFHLGEANLASSPWIILQHLWWAAVWVSDRVSHVCWMCPKSCIGRSGGLLLI